MTSGVHRWLVLWTARRMSIDGLQVCAYDGPTPQGGRWNVLPAPFTAFGAKPDLWATNRRGDVIALGEAKTAADVCNAHTVSQLTVFGRLKLGASRRPCPLYIAVPHSAAQRLDRVLASLSLAGAPHIVRVHVPDVLLQVRNRGRS